MDGFGDVSLDGAPGFEPLGDDLERLIEVDLDDPRLYAALVSK